MMQITDLEKKIAEMTLSHKEQMSEAKARLEEYEQG